MVGQSTNVKILDMTTNPLYTICMAARTCYNSREKDTQEKRPDFIRGLIKSGHETPLEFADVVFDIRDISRACSHQLVRHRIASYCQMSQRYVSYDDKGYIIPASIDKNEVARKHYEDFVRSIRKAYIRFVESFNIPKEDARYILPECMCTNITVKMNFRALRNFLKLRLDKHAQWEIRNIAEQMKQLMIDQGLECIVEDI